ncbi:MDR family MFS transporter [Gordonia sp. (in: high G+C Gram-positive bacteria)]|uniref:MDR family MFS transporter n=1 Tax=Gordonia sp. (in: high G+C Gram-positive bacteria) TaxID=84139 RepID=UPI0016AC1272|nr:MDR family MFS transporter [Gordonia sp. (in: high G+C Gram-positive bacteria)]NLG46229.1 multidrug efflux MFS transporter [Gordonia sp. (in: high G+C Gram-positive bacteria)]
MTSTTAAHPSDDRLARTDLTIIATLIVATFVVILNETVMSVALPVLQRDLGADPTRGQWLTTIFMLTMAVVIPLTGFLIQRFGTRTMYLAAMTLFAAGTALAVVAPGFSVLLGARVIQALGTAIMLPLLMTTVMTLVPETRRGVMMGNISVVIAVAPALGPTLSGFILDHWHWRWIFGVVLPIALIALVVGAIFVRPVGDRTSEPVDYASLPMAVFGFGGLVYGLVAIGEAAKGEASMPVWIPFLVGGAGLAFFVLRQLHLQRTDRALLDLRVFASPAFTLAIVLMVAAMATMMGTFIVVPYFAQEVLQLSPSATGLLMLPGGLLMGLAAPLIGRIYDARGARILVIPGTLLIASGVWLLTLVTSGASAWLLVGGQTVLCLGLAATFTPLMTLSLSSLTPRLYSHGSAVLGTLQQVAGAAGTALFITIMTVVSTADQDAGVAGPDAITNGVRTVFYCAGALALVVVALGLLVRTPKESDAAVPDDERPAREKVDALD